MGEGLLRQGMSNGLVALLLIIAAVSVRLLEWPAWAAGPFWLGDDPILAANDAYAWLAGAEGTGRMQGWPMARLLATLDWALPWSLAQIAFFLPLVLAPLPALLLLLLARRRDYLPAVLTAGILAACGLSFLVRTRLGYADTQLFAMPAALGLAIIWMRALLSIEEAPPGIHWGWLLLACVLAALSVWAYPSALFVLVGISAAAWVAHQMAGGHTRQATIAALAVLMSLHLGGVGLLIGIALCWCGARDVFRGRTALLLLLALLAVLGVLLFDYHAWAGAWRRVLGYFGYLHADSDWLLPSVSEGIWETTGESLGNYTSRLAGHWAFTLAGLAGYTYLVVRRLEWLVFAPLLLLGLAGFWLGPRFAMYATPVLGIGLGFGLAGWLSERRYAMHWQWSVQLLLAASLLGTALWYAQGFTPRPALTASHAQALQALRNRLPEPATGVHSAVVWEWWGLGYAAQYYAGMPTLADGGSTSRRHALMLGRVMGAKSPREAADWMRYAAFERYKASSLGHQPLVSLNGLSGAQAEAELKQRLAAVPRTESEAYLVVSWHALRRAEWINRFARWSLSSGDGGHGESYTLQPPVDLNQQTGVLRTDEGAVRLASLTILEGGNHYAQEWSNPSAMHAVINNDLGEGVLLDDELFNMLAVQMLVKPPESFTETFDLVADLQSARVFKAR